MKKQVKNNTKVSKEKIAKTNTPKTKIRKKRIVLISVTSFILFVLTYALIGCLPYSGALKINEETKNSFSVNNFINDDSSNVCHERVMVLEDQSESFLHRLNLIEHAKDEIFFTTFLTQKDKTTDLFFSSLLNAAGRGVKVYILIDSKSCNLTKEIKYALIANSNINYYEFSAINFFKPQYINFSMHDKIFTIDNTYMILGGRNIGNKYFDHDNSRHAQNFLDREVLVYNTLNSYKGSIIQSKEYCKALINSTHSKKMEKLSKRNIAKGQNKKSELLDIRNDYMEKTDFTGIDDYENSTISVNNISLITNPIEGTKKEPVIAYNLYKLAKSFNKVTIQSPYLTLTNKDLKMFSEISQNTKKFVLLTDSIATTSTPEAFSNYYVNRKKILKTGVEIYEFQDDKYSNHAKTVLFGDRLTAIGSFNFDERSIRIDTESMLVIDSEEFNGIIEDCLDNYYDKSLKVNSENEYEYSEKISPAKVSAWRKTSYPFIGYILTPFKYLL